MNYSCTAHRQNLDGDGGPRSREHTEDLVEEIELGTLWKEYGLVGDIVVWVYSLLQFTYN